MPKNRQWNYPIFLIDYSQVIENASSVRWRVSAIQFSNKKAVWSLAWLSFCWSASSLMVFSVLPVYMTEHLHVSHTNLGLMEGIAIFSAFLSKIGAGIISDATCKRKPLITLGSWITAGAKLAFASAWDIRSIFLTRLIDRFGKGIRSSPVDAFLADLGTPKDYGSIYGLRQAMYTLGAVAGATLAFLVMHFYPNEFRLLFVLSFIPAAAAILILIFAVKPSPISTAEGRPTIKWSFKDVQQLPKAYWLMLSICSLLMISRFSEAFITLKAKNAGLSVAFLPLTVIVMDLIHAFFAFPSGRMSDRFSKPGVLCCGLLITILANFVMYTAHTPWQLFLGVAMIGLHMGITQGVLRAMIADTTPKHIRGTAFSIFYLVCGVAVLIGNFFAGYLADHFGLGGPFLMGALFCTLALLCLCVVFFFKIKIQHTKKSLQLDRSY